MMMEMLMNIPHKYDDSERNEAYESRTLQFVFLFYFNLFYFAFCAPIVWRKDTTVQAYTVMMGYL